MKWAHMPVQGGLSDQHPELLDGFRIIFAERDEAEAEERKKQESKNRTSGNSGSRASRPPRPRRR